MAEILHLLTRKDDPFAAQIIASQQAAGHEVKTIDLTVPAPDYEDVVKQIFATDSVAAW